MGKQVEIFAVQNTMSPPIMRRVRSILQCSTHQENAAHFVLIKLLLEVMSDQVTHPHKKLEKNLVKTNLIGLCLLRVDTQAKVGHLRIPLKRSVPLHLEREELSLQSLREQVYGTRRWFQSLHQ